MVFSIVSTNFQDLGKQKYETLKSIGFDAIDYSLTNTDDPLYTLPLSDALTLIQNENKALHQAGLHICQIHGPWRFPPKDDTAENREERMEKMQRCILLSEAIACPNVVVHPLMPYGLHDKITKQCDLTRKINLEFMSTLVDFAARHEVTVCYENMPFPEFSIGTPQEILSIVESLNHPNFRICLDTGHVNFYHKATDVSPKLNVGEEIRRVGPYIACFHLHDNDGHSDSHLIPSFGRINWQDTVNAIRDIGYSGALSLETKLPKNLTPELSRFSFRYAHDIVRYLLQI